MRQPVPNYTQDQMNIRPNPVPSPTPSINNEPTSASSFFFSPKKKNNQEPKETVGPAGDSVSLDSLNVDFSKIGFNKKPGNSKDLLPSFITNNLDKK